MRLADLWTGAETLRHVAVLIRSLPADSALAASLPLSPIGSRPSRRPRWGHTDYLLADIVDVLAAANWQRGGGKRPAPYPRPGDVDTRPVTFSLTDEQLAALRARGPVKEADGG